MMTDKQDDDSGRILTTDKKRKDDSDRTVGMTDILDDSNRTVNMTDKWKYD
jgi:hypothetical protein